MDMTQKFLEQPKVGTIRLSEAIRIGAKLRGQTRTGHFFHDGKSCALGAALEATGTPYQHFSVGPFSLVNDRFALPFGLDLEIAERNDQGHMTREQIADWLESQGL